jgi:kynurenine aminotransferase
MNIGERFLRFAFCKDLDTLHKAGEQLRGITKLYNKEPSTTALAS